MTPKRRVIKTKIYYLLERGEYFNITRAIIRYKVEKTLSGRRKL